MVPDRFSKVTKDLYRGGKPSPNDLVMLKNLGIKKIVSLDDKSGKDIHGTCKELGFNHVIWGLGDGNDPKISALKKRIIPTLTHGGPTYVHCFHGKDRTGMGVAMFRVYNGWDIENALAEAFEFGMGKDLEKDVRDSYYSAVKDFAKELSDDKNSADVVSLMREQNSFAPQGTGLDDMTTPRSNRSFLPPHADIEFSHLSRTASNRLFCKCKSSNLLKPKVFWWGSPSSAKANPTDSDGVLFSANLCSGTKVERFDKRITDELMRKILLNDDIDVAALRNEQYLVLFPGSLINIREEDDINDFMPEVGGRDNSTDYTFSYPGSGAGIGGMPDGAAGFVQLPFSGQGNV